jgi:hypothetical protein
MWMRELGSGWMGLAAAVMLAGAVVSASAADCVVCGEPTEGGSAVVHGNRAYPIHEYPCRATWNRAVAQGHLDGREGPLEPAGAWVQGLDTERATAFPGNPVVWLLFLAAAMTVSGGMAVLFAGALHRRRGAAFLLGFCVPAVGMVLVPVLPRREEPDSAAIAAKEGIEP